MDSAASYIRAIMAIMLAILLGCAVNAFRGHPAPLVPAAVRLAQTTLREAPSAESYNELSFEFFRAGMPARSVETSLEAIRLNPRMAGYFNNLCAAYNDLHQYQQAVVACENALRLDPALQLARNNLVWARSHL